MQEKIQQLRVAKENVLWLVEHANSLVDSKGIVYWAGRVETLREEIKKEL